MPTFRHISVDGRNKKIKGFVEAESKARAFTQLQDKGLMPLSLTPMADQEGGVKFGKLSLAELLPGGAVRLAESFHYLGVLLQSGHSLAKGLDLIGRMSGAGASRTWLNIRDKVETGERFSKALEEYPRIFPGVYVGMIRVAESTGNLGMVLERIAVNEEKRGEVKGRLLTALAYPSVILLVGMGAVYFLLSGVLPKLSAIFEAQEGALPATTVFLLSVGKTLEAWGPGVLLIPVLFVLFAVLYVKRSSAARQHLDKQLWKLPLVRKQLLASFSDTLGFQLESGIPLVQAMRSAAAAVGSSFFKQKILEAGEEVATGKALDRVLEAQGIYPDIYILTLAAGRKSGKLGPFLTRLAAIMEKDTDNALKRTTALAEPLLILIVGLVVGFIVMAIMEPIFTLTTLVG
jgi:general secretion pathway protein F/type IV pilus assembly protein PilC